MVVYGFMDACRTGFGSTLERSGEVPFRMGVWGKDDEGNSSNWHEFENLVMTLEAEAEQGNLDGALLVLAVDNFTVGSCIYKGNLSSEKLFDLILRFKDVELKTGAKFLVSHVAGERMKIQGTDGISRGYLHKGISLEGNMLASCPWHKTTLEQNDKLKDRIISWAGKNAEFLTPIDCFVRGHDIIGGCEDSTGFWRPKFKTGTMVWIPPPAA